MKNPLRRIHWFIFLHIKRKNVLSQISMSLFFIFWLTVKLAYWDSAGTESCHRWRKLNFRRAMRKVIWIKLIYFSNLNDLSNHIYTTLYFLVIRFIIVSGIQLTLWESVAQFDFWLRKVKNKLESFSIRGNKLKLSCLHTICIIHIYWQSSFPIPKWEFSFVLPCLEMINYKACGGICLAINCERRQTNNFNKLAHFEVGLDPRTQEGVGWSDGDIILNQSVDLLRHMSKKREGHYKIPAIRLQLKCSKWIYIHVHKLNALLIPFPQPSTLSQSHIAPGCPDLSLWQVLRVRHRRICSLHSFHLS